MNDAWLGKTKNYDSSHIGQLSSKNTHTQNPKIGTNIEKNVSQKVIRPFPNQHVEFQAVTMYIIIKSYEQTKGNMLRGMLHDFQR